MTDPIIAATPAVDRDLPCVRCQYNLRTLAADARCPECGLAVEHSLAFEQRHPGGLRRPWALVLFAGIGLAMDLIGGAGMAWALWVNVRGFAATRTDVALVFVGISVNGLCAALTLPVALCLLWNAGPVRRASVGVTLFRAGAVVAVGLHVIRDLFLAIAAVPIIAYLLSPGSSPALASRLYDLRRWVEIVGSPVVFAVLALMGVYLWDLARACREPGMQRFTVGAFATSGAVALAALALDLADMLTPPGTRLAFRDLLVRGSLAADLGLVVLYAGFYWPGVIRMVRRTRARR